MADYVLSAKGTYDGSNMDRGLQKSTSLLGKMTSGGSKLGGMFKGLAGKIAIGNIAANAFGKVMGAVSGSIDSAVKRVDTMNSFPKVMANMSIDADKSSASIKRLSEGIDGLPTALDTAVSGVQRFVSKNSDIEKSTDYFLAMNDAILAGQAPAEVQASAIEQLSQSYSKGKMDMQEWRSIQQAMPAQLNQIAKSMNMTADELGEGLRKGNVSMDDFMDKIVELDKEGGEGFASFAEQAKTSTGGIGTAMANVQNRINKAIANIIDEIGGENIANAINGVSSHFKDAAEPVVEIIRGVKESLDFSGAAETLSPFIGQLGELSAGLFDVKNEAGEITQTGLIHEIGNAMGEGLSIAAQAIADFAADKIPKIQGALSSIAPFTDKAGEAFGHLAESMEPLASVVGPLIDQVIDAVGQTIANTVAVVIVLAGSIADAIATVIDIITQLADAAPEAFEAFTDAVSDAWSDAQSGASSAWSAIQSTVSGAWNAIVSTVTGAWNTVVSTAQSVPGRILGFFSGIGGRIGSQFQMVKTAVTAVFNAVVSTISGIPGRIVGFFSGLGGRITSAIGSIHFPQPSVSYSSVTVGKLSIPIPHVTWNARGGILTDASIIGMGAGGFYGAGEAGAEAIVPLETPKYVRKFAGAIADEMDWGGSSGKYVYEINLYYSGEETAERMVRDINRELEAFNRMRG